MGAKKGGAKPGETKGEKELVAKYTRKIPSLKFQRKGYAQSEDSSITANSTNAKKPAVAAAVAQGHSTENPVEAMTPFVVINIPEDEQSSGNPPALNKPPATVVKKKSTSAVNLAGNLPAVTEPEKAKRPSFFACFVACLWAVAAADAAAKSFPKQLDNFVFQPVHVLIPFWVCTMIAAVKCVSEAVEKVIGKDRVFAYTFNLYSLESPGLLVMGLGAYLQSISLLVIASFVMCQGCQLYRIQRKTTGTQAVSTVDRMLLTSGVFAHHTSTFLYLSNPVTVAFVTGWRMISISGHSMLYVKDKMNAPMWVIHLMGWSRVVVCVGIVQPFLLWLLWSARRDELVSGSWQADLASGLEANATGMIAYLLYRGWRMWTVLLVRNREGIEKCNTANPLNSYGRQKPILEIEVIVLHVLALLLLPAAVESIGSAMQLQPWTMDL
jgi:hypothetical protein